jgi:hypothetical protein
VGRALLRPPAEHPEARGGNLASAPRRDNPRADSDVLKCNFQERHLPAPPSLPTPSRRARGGFPCGFVLDSERSLSIIDQAFSVLCFWRYFGGALGARVVDSHQGAPEPADESGGLTATIAPDSLAKVVLVP